MHRVVLGHLVDGRAIDGMANVGWRKTVDEARARLASVRTR